MRSLITVLAAVLASFNLYAQGKVSFSNVGANDSEKVRLPDGTLVPAGTRYNVALYFDPLVSGSPASAFVQIGAAAPIGVLGGSPGIFAGGDRTIPVGDGGVVIFQVRGWDTAFGTSYEQALAQGGPIGTSTIFRMDTATGADPVMGVRGTGTFQTGFMWPVPEPASISLGALAAGVGALLLLRSRK
jgi:hypothetical protein